MRRWNLLVLAFVAACSSKGGSDTPSGENDVIGGFDASSASLNAIGTVGFNRGGQYFFFCTATLIGPRTVLTAKHCAIDFSPPPPVDAGTGDDGGGGGGAFDASAEDDGGGGAFDASAGDDGDGGGIDAGAPSAQGSSIGPRRFLDEGEVVFGIGPDASKPIRTVAAIDVATSPIDQGGFVGLGSDVAVYTLAEEVTDITPLKVAAGPPDASIVGKTLSVVGYGYQDQTKTLVGTRRAGSVTIRAIQGKALAAVYPTPQAFFDALAKEDGQDVVDANKDGFQALYDTELLDQYELYAGAAPNNAQLCNGDSGGPLLQKMPDGSRQVVAVSSAVIVTTKLPCTMGSAHATFGPKVQDMFSAALSDPCGGITAAGKCDGTVATRCTRPNEGPRALVKTDCADLGLTCGKDDTGTAACVDGNAGADMDAAVDAGTD